MDKKKYIILVVILSVIIFLLMSYIVVDKFIVSNDKTNTDDSNISSEVEGNEREFENFDIEKVSSIKLCITLEENGDPVTKCKNIIDEEKVNNLLSELDTIEYVMDLPSEIGWIAPTTIDISYSDGNVVSIIVSGDGLLAISWSNSDSVRKQYKIENVNFLTELESNYFSE